MHSKDITSHFVINRQTFDCRVTVSIDGKNKELMWDLIGKIYFDLDTDRYEFAAYCPDENTVSLERVIFVKLKDVDKNVDL